MKALPTNKLVNHISYPKILLQYNELLQKNGKVNNKKFYEEVVVKDIPRYSLQSWYFFLKRFRTQTGLVVADKKGDFPMTSRTAQEIGVSNTLLSNSEATAKFVQTMLTVGANRAKEILENPESLTHKEAVELMVKVMKAQDSRMHAIGKIREDDREERKMEKAFANADF